MRMPQGIQWKITLPFITVIMVCMGAMGFYLVHFVRGQPDQQPAHLSY